MPSGSDFTLANLDPRKRHGASQRPGASHRLVAKYEAPLARSVKRAESRAGALIAVCVCVTGVVLALLVIALNKTASD
jgi:hypothetical protein